MITKKLSKLMHIVETTKNNRIRVKNVKRIKRIMRGKK